MRTMHILGYVRLINGKKYPLRVRTLPARPRSKSFSAMKDKGVGRGSQVKK